MRRRSFLKNSVGAGSFLLTSSALPTRAQNSSPGTKKFKKIVFSKQLEWISDYDELMETIAEIGFEGIELTTRPGGHVLPERVEEDLPRMYEAAKKANIEITMIATRITDSNDKFAVPTLKTASSLKIPFYRMGGLSYSADQNPEQTLSDYKSIFRDLAQLNEKYNIHGAYQSHAGSRRISAPTFDLWYLLKDLNPKWIGCEYDTRHTQIENGSWWPVGLKLLGPYVKSMVAKDFVYVKSEGKRRPQNCEFGAGEVDFKAFFSLVKELNISGPISMHFPWKFLPEPEKLSHIERRKQTIRIMREKGIKKINAKLREAGLAEYYHNPFMTSRYLCPLQAKLFLLFK